MNALWQERARVSAMWIVLDLRHAERCDKLDACGAGLCRLGMTKVCGCCRK